jgi:hypothetical protein
VIHLVYVSRARPRFMAEQLQDLLARSRASNVKAGITGMLLHKDSRFMQVLEGEETAVVDLYRRIAVDPRHCEVVPLLREPLAARQFADWFMGFSNLDEPGMVGRPGYLDFLHTPLTSWAFADDVSRCMSLLRVFQQNMRGRGRFDHQVPDQPGLRARGYHRRQRLRLISP